MLLLVLALPVLLAMVKVKAGTTKRTSSPGPSCSMCVTSIRLRSSRLLACLLGCTAGAGQGPAHRPAPADPALLAFRGDRPGGRERGQHKEHRQYRAQGRARHVRERGQGA